MKKYINEIPKKGNIEEGYYWLKNEHVEEVVHLSYYPPFDFWMELPGTEEVLTEDSEEEIVRPYVLMGPLPIPQEILDEFHRAQS